MKIESLIFPLQLMPRHFPGGCEREERNSFGVRAREGRRRGAPGTPPTAAIPALEMGTDVRQSLGP